MLSRATHSAIRSEAACARPPRARALALVAFTAALALALCAPSGMIALRALDAARIAADAQMRVATLAALIGSDAALSPAMLDSAQRATQALAADATRLQADLAAVGAPAAFAAPLATIADDAAAGANLIAVARVALAHLRAPVSSAAAGWSARDTQAVAAHLAAAVRLLRLAAPASVGALGRPALASLSPLASLVSLAQTLAQVAARLPAWLGDAQSLAHALTNLLGAQQPTRLLLLLLDSDELRPTGGFIGNYALLTLQADKLAGRVQLRDIYSLDCPSACPFREIPTVYDWMTADPFHFALRDSNLDPDYPTSARVAERLFAQEGGGATQGVISITPALIVNAVRVIGAVRVPDYDVTATAANLTDLIHYFHLRDHLAVRKAFDPALAQALALALIALTPGQYIALGQVVLRALGDGDIQCYFNDPRLEAYLTALDLDGAVKTPQGDSLLVVDTNMCCAYLSEDIAESVADTVTLDAAGDATHNLTITYHYPVIQHIWSQLWSQQGGLWLYRDYVRAIMPATARWGGMQGCAAPRADSEIGHTAYGCTLVLTRRGALTLHLRWVTPRAAQMSAGAHTALYTLLVQHQVGAHARLSVTIIAPPHASVRQALSSTIQAPTTTGGAVTYSGAPARDVTLVVAYALA